jgi:hypothetical protein
MKVFAYIMIFWNLVAILFSLMAVFNGNNLGWTSFVLGLYGFLYFKWIVSELNSQPPKKLLDK